MNKLKLSFLLLAVMFMMPFTAQARTQITSVVTYYVSPTGNDSNDGLTPSTPLLTIQAAINDIYNIDLGNYGAVIQLANGTYTAGATLWAPWIGGNPVNTTAGFGSPVTINGDWVTPSNVVINVTNGSCVRASYGGNINVQGVRCVVNGSGTSLYASAYGWITVTQAMDFGPCVGDHMLANEDGKIMVGHNYYITGNANSHYRAWGGGSIEAVNLTVFNNNGLSFSQAFAWASDTGHINTGGTHFNFYTNSGKTYNASTNSVIDSGGTGYPGSIGGSVSSGGQYK